MKKSSFRIFGLMLFICLAFVQDSFSQDFKPKAESQSLVEQYLNANDSSINIFDGSAAAEVRYVIPEYYRDFINELSSAATTKDAYDTVYSDYISTFVTNNNSNSTDSNKETIDVVAGLLSELIKEQ